MTPCAPPATSAARSRRRSRVDSPRRTSTGQRGNDIMSYGRPNNRGVLRGPRGLRARTGWRLSPPRRSLHEGDVLEFWTNKGHFAHTLGPLEADFKRDGNVRTAPQRAGGQGRPRVPRAQRRQAGFADDPLAPRVRVRRFGAAAHRRAAAHRVSARSEARSADAARTFDIGVAEGDVVEAARTKAVAVDGRPGAYRPARADAVPARRDSISTSTRAWASASPSCTACAPTRSTT